MIELPLPLPLSLPRLEQVLVGFLRQEAERAGFHSGVVGVSGGLDSAVVLLLSARAFGPQQTLALCMPHRSSSASSLADAEAVIALAGCRHATLEITAMIEAFRTITGCDDSLRLGNKMARERMSLLYDRALSEHSLVIGTSNKTELMLGYSTRWGDGAYDLNPLGDLYKQQVRVLARHLGVPASILDKPPSADLWPGQTDEAELGLSYADADAVLWYLVDARGTLARAAAETGVDESTVRRIAQRMRASQFKRSLSPICKLHPRTVGIDFRYPRDWGT